MKTILFMGDSITDVLRNRSDDNYRGSGYATLVAAELGYEKPNAYKFINRGISGNRVIDLLGRIKEDMINLKPDYMSILIGVNDVWHELARQNGVDAEEFEMYYSILITQLQKALPDLKIMILEPFLLKGPATEEKWELFRRETEKRAAAAKRIAEKYSLPFVPLMEKFDAAAEIAPAGHWTFDGVHPTAAGHEIIKRAWLEAFKAMV